MLNIEKVKQSLLDKFLPDFNVTFKRNDKGIVTLTFMDEETHEKVNFKYNEKTNTTTIAPREMEKDAFKYRLKDNLPDIKEILQSLVF